jgi:hypothetical protein
MVEMDRLLLRLRPRRKSNELIAINKNAKKAGGRYILRPSCVAGARSSTAAVTMKKQ